MNSVVSSTFFCVFLMLGYFVLNEWVILFYWRFFCLFHYFFCCSFDVCFYLNVIRYHVVCLALLLENIFSLVFASFFVSFIFVEYVYCISFVQSLPYLSTCSSRISFSYCCLCCTVVKSCFPKLILICSLIVSMLSSLMSVICKGFVPSSNESPESPSFMLLSSVYSHALTHVYFSFSV